MQFPLFSIGDNSSSIIPPIQNFPQAPSAPPVTSGGGYPVDVTGFSGSAADAMNYIVNRLQDIQNILRDNDEHVQHIDQMISGTKQLSQQLASLASIENYENAVSQVHVPQNPYNDPNSSSNFLNTSFTPSQSLNGMLTQLPYGLIFDGNNFNGMGLGYVGNIMGLSGLPIGLDAFPPFMLTSLSPQQFAVGSSLAQQFMGGSNLGPMVGGLGYMAMNFFPMYLGSNPLFSNIGGLMSLSGPLSWGILGNQISSSNGLNGQINLGSVLPSILGNAMVLGSNVLIRSSSSNDPIYQSVMWGGNALQQLLFWMNSSSLNGLYSPVNGINQSNIYGLSPNLSEIYSAGAFGAVEDYLIRSNLRKQPNFLYQFSKKYEKQIIQFTLSTTPGEPVIFFASNRLDKTVFPYASLQSIRSAQRTDSEGSIEISYRKENNLENIQILPVQFINPSWGSGTLVTGISPQSYQSYMILIHANTARLQQNIAIERLDVQLYKDTVNIIQKLTQLQADIKSLREQCQQNYILAIPQISQLEVIVTNQINNQQQFLEKLKNNIENYRQTRYQLLQDRLHIIDMMKEKAALEAGQAASHYLNEIQGQIPSTGQIQTNM
ncbi:hypothetical protein KZZ20_08260 [Methylacidiphilum fumariolicum]|nr:hypothetical protein [Candidatus Methylacidiphilum fumarolicum]